jgi:hypothetical protein
MRSALLLGYYCQAHGIGDQLLTNAGFDLTGEASEPTRLASAIALAYTPPQPGTLYENNHPLLAVEDQRQAKYVTLTATSKREATGNFRDTPGKMITGIDSNGRGPHMS